MTTIYEFSVPAGESLECNMAVSTSTSMDQVNPLFGLGVYQYGDGGFGDLFPMAATIDDSMSSDNAYRGMQNDNGVVSINFKTKVNSAASFKVKMGPAYWGCKIEWNQAQIGCRTYGKGHKIVRYDQND